MTAPVGRLLSLVLECADADGEGRFRPARDRPQQARTDVLVDDLDAADARVLALGARRWADDVVVHDAEYFGVRADPAGHPFCLIAQAEPDLPARA